MRNVTDPGCGATGQRLARYGVVPDHVVRPAFPVSGGLDGLLSNDIRLQVLVAGGDAAGEWLRSDRPFGISRANKPPARAVPDLFTDG